MQWHHIDRLQLPGQRDGMFACYLQWRLKSGRRFGL
jgi:hypothetical protein